MATRTVSLIDAVREQDRLDAWNLYKTGVLRGFAAKGPSQYERQPHGQKSYSHVHGHWEFRDSYIVGEGGAGFGVTMLLYDGLPQWFLQYAGRYDEKAIPCLKAALREAMLNDEFVGGRGVRLYAHTDGYKYVNALSDAPFLQWGTGREYILNPDNAEVGYHIVTWGPVN